MKLYEYEPLYYGTPCQVRYFDADLEHYCGGVALEDRIIDGRTGELYYIEEIVYSAQKKGIHWDDAVIELEWVDLSGAISSY